MARDLLSSERIGRIRDAGAPDGAARLRWMLAEKASRALSTAGRSDGERIVRVSVDAGGMDALGWLRGQRLYPRLYWSGRDGTAEVAAAGVADLQTGDGPDEIDALRKFPPSSGDGEARYYGGGRFDASREGSDEWEPFGSYRFVLPRFELLVDGTAATLVCNLVLPRDAGRREEVLDQIEGLKTPEERGETLPEPLYRKDSPDRAGWERNVEGALAAFSEGRLGKVVLARRAELGFGEDLDGILLARELRDATPGCFHFYVEPEEGAAFLGATPERLFRRDGRTVRSEAVAGTRPRGASSEDDDDLRDDLLRSEKDRSEHGFVKVGIGETLGPLCEDLRVESGVSEMKTASRRHLVSRVEGTLRDGVSDAELLRAVHPTPAVGGHPREGALEEIRTAEPFDRGWWAGPVGWIGADGSEFAVGIRSGLVSGRTLALFSGAGIVEGSVPAEEWAEIEQKIEDFTGAFGLGRRLGHRAS